MFKYFFFLVSFSFLIPLAINSQSRRFESNRITIGMNVVDDSYLKNYNFFNVKEQWQIGSMPSYFSYSRLISDAIFIDVSYSYNLYKKGKLVDSYPILKDMKYSSFDIGLKYNLNSLNGYYELISGFEPFLSGGFGFTNLDEIKYPTINAGFGFYYWFSDSRFNSYRRGSINENLGFIFSAQVKSFLEYSFTRNHIQYAIGIVYKF